MKTIPFSGFILSILILTGCSEKLHELSVDTSNGKTTFNGHTTSSGTISQNSSQYIRKGKAFTIKMNNISPNDSLVLSISEQDIRITGDDPNRFQDSLFKGTTPVDAVSISNQISELKKTNTQIDEKLQLQRSKIQLKINAENDYELKIDKLGKGKPNEKKGYQNSLNRVRKDIELLQDNIYELDEEKILAQQTLDSLNLVLNINLIQNKLYYLNQKKNLLTNIEQKNLLLEEIKAERDSFNRKTVPLLSKEINFLLLATELHRSLDLFNILKKEVENLVFEKEKSFFPSKEEFTVSIKKYQRNSKSGKAEELVQLTFIQHKRFKIFSSIGAHCMIYNGKYAGIYDNKDSVIVRRNGSNIVPSIGTYLNGTWRLNDCLMGISLGIGVPLQLTNNVDMTPNFNVLWTTNFQNQYGRFGVNAGFGIQKVNVLSPGFNVGDNLGTTNLDVPLRAIWTPTFGVGISYNIGERE